SLGAFLLCFTSKGKCHLFALQLHWQANVIDQFANEAPKTGHCSRRFIQAPALLCIFASNCVHCVPSTFCPHFPAPIFMRPLCNTVDTDGTKAQPLNEHHRCWRWRQSSP